MVVGLPNPKTLALFGFQGIRNFGLNPFELRHPPATVLCGASIPEGIAIAPLAVFEGVLAEVRACCHILMANSSIFGITSSELCCRD